MDREILKFDVDVPRIVRLDRGPEGKDVISAKSKKPQVQYTVNNDQAIMWVSPECRDLIVQSGAQAGDDIQIVRTLRGRQEYYSVQLIGDESMLGAPPPQAPPPPPARSLRMVAPPQPPPQPPANGHGYANGHANGHGFPNGFSVALRSGLGAAAAPQPQLQPQPQQINAINVTSEVLALCMRAAIDAFIDAETYAAARGRAFRFGEEDVRAAALSVFINRSKESR